MKLSDLFVNGAVVALSVSEWRARARILPGDLGIESSPEVERALSLGTHRLADAESFAALHEVVAQAKRAIENNSLPFRMIPGSRYVPSERLEALGEELGRCSGAFRAAVESFCDDYDRMRERQFPVLRAALLTACRGDDARAEWAASRLLGEYPTVGRVREKFSLRWFVYTLESVSNEGIRALSEETSEVRSVVRSMVEGLRDDVQTKLGDILGLISRGGKVTARTIESANTVLDRVEGLNILGDEGLTITIAKIRDCLARMEAGGEMMAVAGLMEIESAMKADLDAAVAAAEATLTGLGRRKLAVSVPVQAAESGVV